MKTAKTRLESRGVCTHAPNSRTTLKTVVRVTNYEKNEVYESYRYWCEEHKTHGFYEKREELNVT